MSKPRAAVILRGTPHYQRDKFIAGLDRVGFDVSLEPLGKPNPRDILVLWNRYERDEADATRYEMAGARVVIAENGYLGVDKNGHQLYALALGYHLGAGKWNELGGDLADVMPRGVVLQTWRSDGDQVVVLAQRGIGTPGVAMPAGWVDDVIIRLRKVTDRPVVLREHPGKDRTDPWDALQGAWAAVTWASGAGLKSIVYGIPVFYEMDRWIGAGAAKFGITDIENPYLGDRLRMLKRLAWAQWSVDELASGEAFRCLLA